jgi:hypothetical protein
MDEQTTGNLQLDDQDVEEQTEVQVERLSILDQLGEIRQEIKEQAEPLDLEVPGYKGLLFVRFRPFPVARTERKVEQFQRQVKKKQPIVLNSACDTLIDACEQLLVKNTDGELIPIDEDMPVGFEQRLAEMLKMPGADQMTSARQVIKGLFPTEQSILKMASTVNEWLQGELNEEADEEFLGESEGTTR